MAQDDKPLTKQQQTGIGRPSEFTWERFERVCETLAKTGQKYRSCDAHGFTYGTVADRIKERAKAGDPRWQELWDMSLERYRDDLEAEAHRRAFEGTEEGVWYKGEMVGTEKRYSDRLMEVLLRGERPAKFRDNVKLDADITGGVLVVPADMTVEEYLARLKAREEAENG
jgi:hypothetical protein